jgi:putative ABC transport system permease protein
MEFLVRDVRFAVRSLAAKPGFTLAAILCAALGIGLCTTIFSAVYAMLVRPFPFAEPDAIVGVVSTNSRTGVESGGVSFLDYSDLRREGRSFAQIAAYSETGLTFSGNGEPEQVQGGAISADLFPLLGVRPVLGRPFLPEEDRPGAPGAVLLSHALWVRSFGSDPKAVGRWVRVDNAPHRIVGVMPPRFQFPVQEQAWVPMAPRLADHARDEREVDVIARLKPGVSLERARAEAAAMSERLAGLYPETHAAWRWQTLPLRDLYVSSGMRVMNLTMMGAATFVLLIACANVANLLLARAASRQKEISLRAVFGASPGQVVRQLLTESLVLAACGGLLGVAVAVAGIRALKSLFAGAATAPFWIVFSLDLPVLAFTAAAAVATGLLFGIVPALQAAKIDLLTVLKEGERGTSGGRRRSRLRSALVVAEIGLSAVLLIGGALFVRSFFELQQADSGFEEDRLLTLRVHLPGEAYDDEGARLRKVREVLERIESLPGVEAAYASAMIPLAGGIRSSAIEIEGQTFPEDREPRTDWAAVTPGFFRTLGVPVERGQSFTGPEGWERKPVAVVNQAFARRFFPQGDPIGKRLLLRKMETPEWLTIVGVVPDFKVRSLERPAAAAAWVPYRFLAVRGNGIVVRTRLAPQRLTAAVRRAVQAADPGIPLSAVATMADVRTTSIWQYQIVSRMFSTFGLLALFLAAVGIYGVLSYTVNQRRHEMGTRLALGAQRSAVLRLIVRQGLTLAALGVAVGLAGAFFLAQLLSSFLYGIQSTDPVSFAGLSLFLLAVAGLASYLPARRATRVNPVEALRES